MFGLFRAKWSKDKHLYRAIKNILGFYPGNIFLYKLAFRHRSVSRVSNGIRRNNERLEYLGDAVLSASVAHYLFSKYPTQDEGFLTEMRSKMVSRATLNKVGLHLGLHNLIQIESNAMNGGFKSVDGDALEALIGATFLDKGFKFTQKVILQRIVGIHMDVDELERKEWNYKSKLIDWGQKEKIKVDFRVIQTIHQGSKRLYKVEVLLDGEVKAVGLNQSVKSAEQLAAENTYKQYVEPWIASNSSKHSALLNEDQKKYIVKKTKQALKPERLLAQQSSTISEAFAAMDVDVDVDKKSAE